MKVRFAVISPDILAQTRAVVEKLQHAVNTGDMDGVDAATEQLVKLTAHCRSVDLSEEEWRAFLGTARSIDPAFESGYLLPGEVCTSIFPFLAASDQVLELPIDDTAEDTIHV